MRRVVADPWKDPAGFKVQLERHFAEFEEHFKDPANRERPQIREDWYKRFRDHLIELFHGKCAYCEIPLVGQHKGDVEHFRPKNAVVEEDGARAVDSDGRPHPGYWWLAYEWGNLLPACRDCNSTNHKGNKFPVFGQRADRRPDLDVPKLINPLFDEPSEHIAWNVVTGSPVALDERGESTIKNLGLDEPRLNDLRLELKLPYRRRTRIAITRAADAEELADALDFIGRARSGATAFSAYSLAVIQDERDRIKKALDGFAEL
jgi:uncharacterized protein (TIGR02646 family)